jgi:hypothetical protein
MSLAQIGQVLREHGIEGLHAASFARSSKSHCITAHVLPVRLNARQFVIANIASRCIGIRLELIRGNVLLLRLQPIDNDLLHRM